jgi:hypothetical protein
MKQAMTTRQPPSDLPRIGTFARQSCLQGLARAPVMSGACAHPLKRYALL